MEVGGGMKVFNILDVMNRDDLLYSLDAIERVDFLTRDENEFIFETSKGSLDTIKNWFDTIGIDYDSISIENRSIIYCTSGNRMSLCDLSHGERFLLYILAGKSIEKRIIALGLFEILGSRLLEVAERNLKDYNNHFYMLSPLSN